MRRDFFELVEYARRLMFNVKIKTNAVMITEKDARRIRELDVDTIQISVYSHRPEVHDAITKLPHSLERTIKAIRFLREQGLRVTIANVLMTVNSSDHLGVQKLAAELDVHYTLDPTITPMMDGDTSVLALRIPGEELPEIFRNPALVASQEEFCEPPKPPSAEDLEGYSCSAGHSFCYISPYGDVFPLRPVSPSHGKHPSAEVFGYLESFPGDERGSLDPGQRSDRLLIVLARHHVHALSGLGLCRRKHAGPIHRRLREVVLPHRRADREHVAARAVETAHHRTPDPDSADRRSCMIQARPLQYARGSGVAFTL
jgi:hypothetical protein